MLAKDNVWAQQEAMFAELTSALESYFGNSGVSVSWVDNLSAEDRNLIRRTFQNVCSFLNDNNLFNNGVPVNSNLFQVNPGNESVNSNITNVINHVGPSKIVELCTNCGIHQKDLQTAATMVGNILMKYSSGTEGYSGMVMDRHFGSITDTPSGKAIRLADLRSIYPASLHKSILGNEVPGVEAFGADTDRVLPDIRVAITVGLLKMHRSLLDRIMHRRTSSSTLIRYVIPYAEVYDLMKSMDPSGAVRNSSSHRIPFIDLYADPAVVSNTLRPIVPLLANDTNNAVLRDGWLRTNTKANLMDLARIPGQIGYNHTDYTDLIADGVILDSIVISLRKGTTTEEFIIPVRGFSKSRLMMQANTVDSADRATIFSQVFKFNAARKTSSGADSTILAGLDENDCLEVEVNMTVSVNLKFHTVASTAVMFVRPYTASGNAPAQVVLDAMQGLEAQIIGYKLDAKYSEENLRKTHIAVRSHYRTLDFEIPVGRNIVVDYAMNEALPEYVMANVTEALSLGQDHRALDIIIRTLMDTYDRLKEENKDPNFRDNLQKIGFDHVAAQIVRPTVYLGTIDLEEVDTMRSSDILGDIRQYVELQLINMFSLLHQNSYYKTQLNPGEKPVYKVITSAVILENLLNVPHIHNHLQVMSQEDAGNVDTVEYRRVLPSGVVLECVSTTFDYLRDRIIVIPYRPNDPESILNFGHNWDYGTYIAHYTPQIANGVNKRVFANAREMPFVTNPIGLYIQVKNISKIIDMFQLNNPRGTSGASLPDIESRLPDTSTLKGPGNKNW